MGVETHFLSLDFFMRHTMLSYRQIHNSANMNVEKYLDISQTRFPELT